MSGLFGGLFKIAQSSDSQGPTPEQLREAEENGLEWDDRSGFYRPGQESSHANETDPEDEQKSDLFIYMVDENNWRIELNTDELIKVWNELGTPKLFGLSKKEADWVAIVLRSKVRGN